MRRFMPHRVRALGAGLLLALLATTAGADGGGKPAAPNPDAEKALAARREALRTRVKEWCDER